MNKRKILYGTAIGLVLCALYAIGDILIGSQTLGPGATIDYTNTTATVLLQSRVNAQTGTSYAINNTDRGKLITQGNAAAIADTLAQAGTGGNFLTGWYTCVENTGAGLLTITPTTSTVDGAASVSINTNQGLCIWSDGSNYFTQRGMGDSQHTIPFVWGDGTATLSANGFAYYTIPNACKLSAWSIGVDAGTATVKFWRVANGTATPTSGNSINTAGVAISSNTYIKSGTLSDFTLTQFNALDVMAAQLTAVATAKAVTAQLYCLP